MNIEEKVLNVMRTDADLIDQLKKSEQRYKIIIENSEDMMCIVRREGRSRFRFEWINSNRVEEISGYPAKEIENKSIFAFVHIDDQKKALDTVIRGMKYGSAMTTIRMVNKSGEWRWVEVRGRIFKDYDGEMKALLVGKDITTQVETKTKLIQSEKKYRKLFKYSPFMILIINTEGIIVDFNPTVTTIGQYHDEDLMGMRFQELSQIVPEQYQLTLVKLLATLLKDGKIEPTEIQLKKADGTIIWVLLHANFVEVEGETFIQVFLPDITALKKKEVNK